MYRNYLEIYKRWENFQYKYTSSSIVTFKRH